MNGVSEVVGVIAAIIVAITALAAAVAVVRSSHTKASLSITVQANEELRRDLVDADARWTIKLAEAEKRWEVQLTVERERRIQVEGRLQAMTSEWATTVASAIVEAVVRTVAQTAPPPFPAPAPLEVSDDHA